MNDSVYDDVITSKYYTAYPLGPQKARLLTAGTDMDDLIESFKHMTLGELTEFNRRFMDTFGVTAEPSELVTYDRDHLPDQPMPDEPVAFTVRLLAVGPHKVPVIKVVRTLTGLGLKEAKELVESAPADVLTMVTEEAAEKAVAALAAEGATAEMLPIYDDSPDYLGPQ